MHLQVSLILLQVQPSWWFSENWNIWMALSLSRCQKIQHKLCGHPMSARSLAFFNYHLTFQRKIASIIPPLSIFGSSLLFHNITFLMSWPSRAETSLLLGCLFDILIFTKHSDLLLWYSVHKIPHYLEILLTLILLCVLYHLRFGWMTPDMGNID